MRAKLYVCLMSVCIGGCSNYLSIEDIRPYADLIILNDQDPKTIDAVDVAQLVQRSNDSLSRLLGFSATAPDLYIAFVSKQNWNSMVLNLGLNTSAQGLCLPESKIIIVQYAVANKEIEVATAVQAAATISHERGHCIFNSDNEIVSRTLQIFTRIDQYIVNNDVVKSHSQGLLDDFGVPGGAAEHIESHRYLLNQLHLMRQDGRTYPRTTIEFIARFGAISIDEIVRDKITATDEQLYEAGVDFIRWFFTRHSSIYSRYCQTTPMGYCAYDALRGAVNPDDYMYYDSYVLYLWSQGTTDRQQVLYRSYLYETAEKTTVVVSPAVAMTPYPETWWLSVITWSVNISPPTHIAFLEEQVPGTFVLISNGAYFVLQKHRRYPWRTPPVTEITTLFDGWIDAEYYCHDRPQQWPYSDWEYIEPGYFFIMNAEEGILPYSCE